MRQVLGATVLITALVLGTSTIASASPASDLGSGYTNLSHANSIEQVDYYWNHHHYHHRAWDREHKRWHYYN